MRMVIVIKILHRDGDDDDDDGMPRPPLFLGDTDVERLSPRLDYLRLYGLVQPVQGLAALEQAAEPEFGYEDEDLPSNQGTPCLHGLYIVRIEDDRTRNTVVQGSPVVNQVRVGTRLLSRLGYELTPC